MQEPDPTSFDRMSEDVQRSKRLFGNQPGGERGIAKALRDAREKKQEQIADISNRLRIRAVYLQAIEEGRYRDLPGDTYAMGFVRSYANYLGLDGEEIVRRFKSEAAVSGQATSLIFPIPAREGRAPRGVILLLSVLLALTVYGVWYAMSYRTPPPERTAPVEEAAPAPLAVETEAEAEAEADAGPSATAEAEVAMDAGPSATAASEESTKAAETPTSILAGPPVASPPPSPAAAEKVQPAAAQADKAQPAAQTATVAFGTIELRAVHDVWIEIRTREDRSILAKILHANESYRPPRLEGLTLAVGDARGVDILIDGKGIAPLGPSGAILRKVLLDPVRLRAGNAVLD